MNGVSFDIGTSPVTYILSNLNKPTELVMGGTKDPKTSETNFNGYIKEFRFWNVARSAYEI